MAPFHAVIIGGGGTGAAVAHDLTLRGFKVTLVERGELTSGTTGRHHGLLHSGARYAVKDKESAVECIEENTILRRIAPGTFELNDGLFVALTDEEVAYSHEFFESCQECGIPVRRLTREEVLKREPNVNPAAQVFQKALLDQGIPLTSFAVTDTQLEYDRLEALGVAFRRKPTPMGPTVTAVFEDTCGNLIQIHQVVAPA